MLSTSVPKECNWDLVTRCNSIITYDLPNDSENKPNSISMYLENQYGIHKKSWNAFLAKKLDKFE